MPSYYTFWLSMSSKMYKCSHTHVHHSCLWHKFSTKSIKHSLATRVKASVQHSENPSSPLAFLLKALHSHGTPTLLFSLMLADQTSPQDRVGVDRLPDWRLTAPGGFVAPVGQDYLDLSETQHQLSGAPAPLRQHLCRFARPSKIRLWESGFFMCAVGNRGLHYNECVA